jgi:hypothetical protein
VRWPQLAAGEDGKFVTNVAFRVQNPELQKKKKNKTLMSHLHVAGTRQEHRRI